MRVGVGCLSAPTRPSSSQRFSLNLWLPSPWIAPSFGRTDHSLLRTRCASFPAPGTAAFPTKVRSHCLAQDNPRCDRYSTESLLYIDHLREAACRHGLHT